MIWNMGSLKRRSGYVPTILILTRFNGSTLQPLNVNPLHALANPGCDFPSDGAGLFAQFTATNSFVALLPHQDRFLANIDIFDMRNIEHDQIHRHASKQRTTSAANEVIGFAVWQMTRVTIG